MICNPIGPYLACSNPAIIYQEYTMHHFAHFAGHGGNLGGIGLFIIVLAVAVALACAIGSRDK